MSATSRRWSERRGRRDGAAAGPSTFLLGAGAHLAGVVALHDYLSASPHCAPGAHREFHVLDSAGLASQGWVRDLLLDQAQSSLDAARHHGRASGAALQRAAMIADPDVYFDYFAGLLARPATRLTMDLTPEHSLLSADQLTTVRQGFEERGLRTVAAFSMRDPLDRLVAHVRQRRQQRPDEHPGSLVEEVARVYAEPPFEARTRYDRTLDALTQAFDPGDLWFGFHERLLSVESAMAISEVCRIPYREPVPPVPTRASPTAGLPEDLARTIVLHYEEVYDQVGDRFGLDDLSGSWPSAELLRTTHVFRRKRVG